jgi:hypothetical protein
LSTTRDSFIKIIKLRYVFGINDGYFELGGLCGSNKTLFNLLFLLLREEHYKLYKQIDVSGFTKKYNYY